MKRSILQSLAILLVISGMSFAGGKKEEGKKVDFPTRPITITIPYAPGGGVDLMGRALGAVLPKYLGQPVVVTNKPGGNGIVGSQFVSQQSPDGYNIGLYASPVFDSIPHINEIPFDHFNAFTFLGTLVERPMLLVVNSGSPYKTFEDFVQYVNNTKGVTHGDPPAGAAFLAFEALKKTFDLKDMKFIPYSGGTAEAVTALLGNHIEAIVALPLEILSNYKAGKLRPLISLSEERLQMFPEVPTAREKGKDLVMSLTNGVVGPQGINREIVMILEEAISKTLKDPEFIALTEKTGDKDFLKYVNGSETMKMLKKTGEINKEIINELGLSKK